VLRIQHLRRLHTFASLYALRDQPMATEESAKDAAVATLLHELRSAMEGASSGLFHELDLALPAANGSKPAAKREHWNGMMASINGPTYAVALWKLVAENIDILACVSL
jgi:hypothetical protein